MSSVKQPAYVNRPNKEYVRSEVVRLIGKCTGAIANPERYCYVSLAGYRFIDLMEVYQRYRIRAAFSIEEDEQLWKRAEFNKPYPWITVFQGYLPEFLIQHGPELRKKSKILFLDYTGPLADNIVQELDALFLSDFYETNGLLFLTLNASLTSPTPYVARNAARTFRLHSEYEGWLKEHVPGLVRSKLRKHFPDKDVREVAKYSYKDTSSMVVFGFKVDAVEALEGEYSNIDFERVTVPDITPIEQHTLRRNSSDGADELSRITGIDRSAIDFFLNHD